MAKVTWGLATFAWFNLASGVFYIFIPSAPKVITTACGPVSGSFETAPSGSRVALYAGIPFAQAPTGPLRWRPPVPHQCPWPGLLNGSSRPPTCMHREGTGAEDCLYLNIAAPENVAGPLPVVVYFHGGNLIGGSAPGEIPKAIGLASEDELIVVTMGYRLGVLGWLAVSEIAEEQSGMAGNYGTHDAILGLTWLQKNIPFFGGDASKVILMGQSSGGTLIFSIMASPAAEGLFAGAISLSGSPNITQNAADKQAQDASLVEAMGCGTGSTAAQRLACMRALPANKVAAVMPGSWGTPGIFGWKDPIPSPKDGGQRYAGIVHVDGFLIQQSFDQALAAGVNSEVGLIISNMMAEPDGGPPLVVRNATKDQWLADLTAAVQGWDNASFTATTLFNLYSKEFSVDPQLAYDSLASDYGLTCAGRVVAERVTSARVRTGPLYLLYNAWPRAQYYESGSGRWPYHGQDWSFMADSSIPSPAPPSDLKLKTILQKMASDFAHGGGRMPDSWNWPAATEQSKFSTYVLAQDTLFPGGGARAEPDWKYMVCQTLNSLGIDERYWWCD